LLQKVEIPRRSADAS